jgi:uracil-DNA glycosylase family 4
MNELIRKHYLQTMGVQLWRQRSNTNHVIHSINNSEIESISQTNLITSNNTTDIDATWANLKNEVAACTACDLCKTRTQTVFGVGNQSAKLLIIGEAPGAQEDRQGFPFVGRAGQLLDAMLLGIGLKREQIYIANILKCRPPNNRDPERTEVAKCTPFLQLQLALIQPKLILALGRIAAHYLLNTTTPMNRLRGQQYFYGESKVPLLVTFHPAYLLRSPLEKAKAYDDLLLVLKMLSTL